MEKPVRFCFIHERIREDTGEYLQLQAGTLKTFTRYGLPMQHEPCDLCPTPEERDGEQLSLFGGEK